MRELCITYDGCALSGRQQSMTHIARELGATLQWERQESGAMWVGFTVSTDDLRLTVRGVSGVVFGRALANELRERADAFVFVVDSQRERLEANKEVLEVFEPTVGNRAVVVQFNKRDLTTPLAVEELSHALNPWRAPQFESVASEGRGVWEPFESAIVSAARAHHVEGELRALLSAGR